MPVKKVTSLKDITGFIINTKVFLKLIIHSCYEVAWISGVDLI